MSEEKSGTKRQHLGRGLAALLGDENEDYASLDRVRSGRLVPIDLLEPNPFQPRRQFDEETLDELADSVRQRGILQPIVVRRHPGQPNAYQIVAGERRWRAAQRAGLHEVPVTVRELDDREVMEIALIENVQRRNLSPLEEAAGYQRLVDDFSYTQEQLAGGVGKSRAHVANTLRLLQLPDEVRTLLDDGSLTAGHGRALLGAEDPVALAHEAVRKSLNVRQVERLVQDRRARIDGGGAAQSRKAAAAGVATTAAPSPPSAKDADTRALERDLANLLGLKVQLNVNIGGHGSVTVHFANLDQLDEVLARLGRS